MVLYFLDKDFALTDYFDGFSSIVWSEKFHSVGTFTLHFPREFLPRVIGAAYVRTEYSDNGVKCGRIDRISTETDGDCVMSGHMLEILLNDRIINGSGVFTGTVTEAVISAVYNNLRDCGVVIGDDQPDIPIEVSIPYDYDNLADWLYRTLRPYGASFSVRLEENNSPVFRIMCGKDRTTDSGESPAVFSTSFGNIVSLGYQQDTRDTKNKAYVKGKDGTVVTVDNSGSLPKHEIHIKADNIDPSDFDSTAAYKNALRLRGNEALSKSVDGMRISAECDPNAVPIYGKDVSLGDLCDVCESDLGLIFSLRLTEVDTVWENGTKTVFPSFGDEPLSVKKLLGDR